MRSLLGLLGSLLLLACGNNPPAGGTLPDGGTAQPPIPADSQLPCEVANLVFTHCVSCHGDPPAGGAPITLIRLSDFTKPSDVDPTVSFAVRAVTRMKQTGAPMPPVNFAPVSATELSAFEAWVNGGLKAGSCATPTVQTTCASGSTWTRGLDGSSSMLPGYACTACHAGNNFLGQNPRGVSQPEEVFAFAGTVFPAFHEANDCNAPPPAGAVVEILDNTGAVALTMSVGSVGNFHSRNSAPVAMPYTARVRVGTQTRTMTTPQTDGDCNTCHTEGGLNGAPGRIVTP